MCRQALEAKRGQGRAGQEDSAEQALIKMRKRGIVSEYREAWAPGHLTRHVAALGTGHLQGEVSPSCPHGRQGHKAEFPGPRLSS